MSDGLPTAEAAVLRAMRTVATPTGEARASLRDLAVLAGTSVGGLRDPLASLVVRGVLHPLRPATDSRRPSLWRIDGFRGRWRLRVRIPRSGLDPGPGGVTLPERWRRSDERRDRR
jgi:hypothetical protein